MAAPRIVIINHDPTYLRLMEHILRAEGFDPVVFTGQGIHDDIIREKPHLIMIDTWLSKRDEGLALLQTLVLDDATKHIPMLIASSDPDDLTERLAEISSRMEVLKKPFTEDMLLTAIHRLLDTVPGK